MAKIVRHDNLAARWGYQDHLVVSKERSFVSMIFELLSEKEPTREQEKLFNLILNLSIDHGPETPSAVATIEAAQGGGQLGEAIAEGMAQINESHGGAIGPCMEILYQLKTQNSNVNTLVAECLEQEKRLPGFGHRLYKDEDPRAQLILKELGENQFTQAALDLARELQQQKGTKLPLNIDGAIATVLCSWGWEPKLGNAVFLIARTPGLVAHYLNNS